MEAKRCFLNQLRGGFPGAPQDIVFIQSDLPAIDAFQRWILVPIDLRNA
jgi:hypothetical protein